jgi:tripartite-type tricarboxylate transporter receptor subunit TctC
MKIQRREFLHLAAGAARSRPSRASRPRRSIRHDVRIIAGYPAGGVNDIYARLIGQRLSERSGQSFIVGSRPGAAGTIGVDSVVRAPAAKRLLGVA